MNTQKRIRHDRLRMCVFINIYKFNLKKIFFRQKIHTHETFSKIYNK